MNALLREKYQLPSIEEFEIEFNKHKNDQLKRLKSTSIITIPVVVHIIHSGEPVGTGTNISAEQVYSQIDVLNEDFRKMSGTNGYNEHPAGADIQIEFAVALRDEYGNTLQEPGIHRVNGNNPYWELNEIEALLKPRTIWNPEKYFNIWTVNFGGDTDGILGYAQFPSLSGLDGLQTNGGLATTDGVVIGSKYFGRTDYMLSQYNGGRTTTHEVGHWLGLRHIWGDGDCSEDDFCDDTPRAAYPNYSCTETNSCLLHPGKDMIENYMDYTPDACMNIFTQDQKIRMQTVMEVCPRRKELKNSNVHLATDAPIANFTSNKTEICSGESITFTDASINNPTQWKWIFFDSEGLEAGKFTTKNPSITFNAIGA
ncbi:MAG: M43 family zinc metalloprotease [Cyclobacteriaceae bacterium]